MSDVATVVGDPARLAALRRLVLLDTGPSEPFDRIVRLTARVLDAPIALITLVDADRQYFKASFGLAEPLASARQTALPSSICQYTVAAGARLVVCDTRVEHWLDDNPAVAELGVRAYAGVPLMTPDCHAVGAICVIDLKPREWTDGELASLEDLAGVVMREVLLHRVERKVARDRRRY
jgi:GAF domain-containing protein